MAKHKVWVARDKNTKYSFLNVYDLKPDRSEQFKWFTSSANGSNLFEINDEDDLYIFMRAFGIQLGPGECKELEIEI